MNRSKERHTFQMNAYIQRCKDKGEEPNETYLDSYREETRQDLDCENNEEWKKNNLEFDLRSTKWICDKAKASESYAQNIYAAMCNQDWQKNDVLPLLKGQTWGCSWRYAGGIVADMVEQGDYIDWYCSGIGGPMGGGSESSPEHEAMMLAIKNFVPEGKVTEEIRNDFFELGWIPVDADDE